MGDDTSETGPPRAPQPSRRATPADVARDERYRELVRASGLRDFANLAPSTCRTLIRLASDDEAVAAVLDLLRAVRAGDVTAALRFAPARRPRPPDDLMGGSGP